MERSSESLAVKTPVLCRVSEAARSLAMSRTAVYGLMSQGLLPYVKLGRSRRIKWADVLGLIDENTFGGDGACT